MPTRDYELVQKAKRDGWVKISVNWLLSPLDCNPAVCKGYCCKNHKGTPTTARYHPEEIAKLPSWVKEFVESDEVTVKLDWKGDCALIPYCQKDSSIIPVECRLFPLGFSKWGRLIMKKPAWTGRCPMYRTTNKPVYLAIKQCLIEIFGEGIYKQIEEACNNRQPQYAIRVTNEEE